MWWNSEQFLSAARNFTIDGLVVTYTCDKKKNSFAQINREGFVTQMKEKEVISNISLNGIHYWRKVSYFFENRFDYVLNKFQVYIDFLLLLVLYCPKLSKSL